MIEPRHTAANLRNTPPNVPRCEISHCKAAPAPEVAVAVVAEVVPEPVAVTPSVAAPVKTLLISEEGMRQALLAIGVDGPAIRKLIKLAEII